MGIGISIGLGGHHRAGVGFAVAAPVVFAARPTVYDNPYLHTGGGTHVNAFITTSAVPVYTAQMTPAAQATVAQVGTQPAYIEGYEHGKARLAPLSPQDAQYQYQVGAELNRFSAETHLTFKMQSDGRVAANTQGLEGFFHKDDLAKVNREAIAAGNPDFVQNLLGGPNSGLRFNGKQVVATGDMSPDDFKNFELNAPAIGEAVRGNYAKALEMYTKIHANDPAQPDQGQSTASQGPQGQGNGQQRQGTGQQGQDDSNIARLGSDGFYHKMNPDGTPGDIVNQQLKTPAAPTPAPVVRTDLDKPLVDKAAVGEAQELLAKLGHTVKLDGLDTRKDHKQGETDKALSAVLGRNVTDGMTLRDLKDLEQKAGITSDDKKKILEDVSKKLHLSGVTSSDLIATTTQEPQPAAGHTPEQQAKQVAAGTTGITGGKDVNSAPKPRVDTSNYVPPAQGPVTHQI